MQPVFSYFVRADSRLCQKAASDFAIWRATVPERIHSAIAEGGPPALCQMLQIRNMCCKNTTPGVA